MARHRSPGREEKCRSLFGASSATNEMEDKDNQGDHEQQVDESSSNMESKSTAPEEQKKNGDNQ